MRINTQQTLKKKHCMISTPECSSQYGGPCPVPIESLIFLIMRGRNGADLFQITIIHDGNNFLSFLKKNLKREKIIMKKDYPKYMGEKLFEPISFMRNSQIGKLNGSSKDHRNGRNGKKIEGKK